MRVQEIKILAGCLVHKMNPYQGLTCVCRLIGARFRLLGMAARPENARCKSVQQLGFIGDGHIVGYAFDGVGIKHPLVARAALLDKAADVQISLDAPNAVANLLYADYIAVKIGNHIGNGRGAVAPITLGVGNNAGLPLLHERFPGTGGANVVGPHLEGLGRGQQGNKEEQKQKFSHSTVIVPLFTQPVSACVAVEYRPVIALVLRVPCEGTWMVRAPLKVHPERPMSLPSP